MHDGAQPQGEAEYGTRYRGGRVWSFLFRSSRRINSGTLSAQRIARTHIASNSRDGNLTVTDTDGSSQASGGRPLLRFTGHSYRMNT